jgi:steroid delta-isomerase-like uncharacterized protein
LSLIDSGTIEEHNPVSSRRRLGPHQHSYQVNRRPSIQVCHPFRERKIITNLRTGEDFMSEENKKITRRLLEDLWNKGNLSLADEFFTANYVHHDPSTPDVGSGPESEKKRATLYRTAFPDLRLTIEDMISEGDTVLARWSASGTHRGELNGIAPTNKKITISGVSVVRFAGRKIAEGWVNWDALGLLQQLGAVPERGKTKRAGR